MAALPGVIIRALIKAKSNNPVILLDEIEKAHPDVFNILLQVLDDGRLTDGQGRTVDFKNTVIVMTSNLGSQQIQALEGEDFGLIKSAVLAEVKAELRPEFVNRIDEIVVFQSLQAEQIASIANIQVELLRQRLIALNMDLSITPAALAHLAVAGFDPVYGARPLKRAIQSELENPLAKAMLAGEFVACDHILISLENRKLVFGKKP